MAMDEERLKRIGGFLQQIKDALVEQDGELKQALKGIGDVTTTMTGYQIQFPAGEINLEMRVDGTGYHWNFKLSQEMRDALESVVDLSN